MTKSYQLPSGRYTGWVRQQPDQRDYKFAPAREVMQALPATVDLTAGMGSVMDQGSLGSCGPNAEASLILFDQHKQELPTTGASRLFGYYTTRQLMGTTGEDSGVDNRTMLKALNQYGFCAETLWPYDISKFTQQPPPAVYKAAVAVRDYAAVAQDVNTIKGCLASGLPFLFGFTVYTSFESSAVATTGIVPLPRTSERVLGGHDVVWCGYSDVQKPGIKPGNVWPANTARFKNSWGSGWGDGGYGYFPYAYGLDSNLSGDFWVINSIPGGTPTPPPPPVTPPAYTQKFSQAIRAGQLVQWRPKVNIAAGTYGAYPLITLEDEVRLVDENETP